MAVNDLSNFDAMNNTVTCLSNVIGLAESGCVCTEEGRPENYAESLSGRYLADEHYGLSMAKLERLPFGNDLNVWSWLEARRKSGTRQFLSALAMNIPDDNRVAMEKHTGFIGDIKEWSYGLVGLNAITGIGLHPKMYRGVQTKIKGFRLAYPGLTEGNIDIRLSTDLLMGVTTAHRTLAFTGNTGNFIHVNVPTNAPLEIDMADQYGQPVSIIVTLANDGNMPLNTRFFCSTCGTPAWGKFFSPQNISVATVDQLIPIAQNRYVQYGAANHGIAVDLTVECSDSWLCSDMNYSARWPRVMAEALQLSQQFDAMQNILRMEATRPSVIFGREELKTWMKNITDILTVHMKYLGVNIPVAMSDCLVCADMISVEDNLI